MRENFQFQVPTQIIFGQACLEAIGSKIQQYGHRALIVAGAMAQNSGALQTVVTYLEKSGIEYFLFDRVGAQPRIREIEEGAQVGRDEKCDVIVGIGGECPMDAAKVIAALAPGSARLSDILGGDKIRSQPLPIIAVPLTAGSGSEVTPLAAITTEGDLPEIKIAASSQIYPTLALVDPTFTLAFPEAVTVANGLDALSHGVEGIMSKNSQPLTDLLAVESIRFVVQYLPEVLSDPQNMTYRSKLSYAAVLAGIVVGQTGMGLAHHMGFYLTLDLGMKHGMANGLLLPWTCEASLIHTPAKAEKIAKAFGADIRNLDSEAAIQIVVDAVRAFTAQFDLISEHVDEKSILEKKIENYAESMLKNADPLLIDPLRLKKEEIENVYRRSFEQLNVV